MKGGGSATPGSFFVRINPHTSAPSTTPAATWKQVGQSRSQRNDVINWYITSHTSPKSSTYSSANSGTLFPTLWLTISEMTRPTVASKKNRICQRPSNVGVMVVLLEPSETIERTNGWERAHVIPVHAAQPDLLPNGVPHIAAPENYRQPREVRQASSLRWHRPGQVHCSYPAPQNRWTLSAGLWDSPLNGNSPPCS